MTFADLAPGRTAVRCDCLCVAHREEAPVICLGGELGGEQRVLPMVGKVLAPHKVAMCGPCAEWWKANRPDRVGIAEPAVES